MKLKLRYGKILGFLGLSAIATLGSGLPAFSQELNSKLQTIKIAREPLEIRLVPPATPASQGSGAPPTTGNDCSKKINQKAEDNQSKRVELYYYRNATNIVDLLGKIPFADGCATVLPLNSPQAGEGVGRGGGNVISLYGTQKYIDDVQRFITSLDLPLPGIDLQLWGVQISSNNPNKLAETTAKVRSRISETQGLLRGTFANIQGISQLTLQNPKVVDPDFKSIAKQLGYADAVDGLGGESSILEVFLVGDSLLEDERVEFYQDLYRRIVSGSNSNSNSDQDFSPLSPYLEALRNDTDSPPFERIFRSRGLEPYCNQKFQGEDENEQPKCVKWKWKEAFVEDVDGKDVSLVDITANYERKVLLEFALHYANFIENPQDFDPGELQRSADNLNELLQNGADLLQKDIEDLFLKPTLAMIQQEVANDKEVEFAQVGRSTISTLDGVQTDVSSSSTSGFQVPQSQDLGQLLARAQQLQQQIGSFIPTETLPGASEASEIVTTGPLPASQAIALAVAALEQKSVPVEIETGTSLAFTPGISRNLNSAELNIQLEVVDPTVTPTAEDKNVPPLSRIGKQEMTTTVYTRALDFFDLSTFTSQATLDGGRWRVPIIGDFWNAIFGPIPVFGDLFSVAKGNQNVLHESLILTNSFITPTPLSLGNLYAPINGGDFCQQRSKLLDYLKTLKPAGEASPRETRIIEKQCTNNP
ncbi:MAG: hypothetical protein AAGF83_13230 [Cyanobacteria bacterium P01_G01_bin.67]